jgi:hypothetical protein
LHGNDDCVKLKANKEECVKKAKLARGGKNPTTAVYGLDDSASDYEI